MRLGGSLALACCKVAVDACFLSSRIYSLVRAASPADPPVLCDRGSPSPRSLARHLETSGRSNDGGRETLARTSLYKEKACTRRAGSDDGFTASHCGLSGTGFLKSEKRGVQAARNGPSEDGKCWQRVELGIHGLNRWAVKCLEMLRNAEFTQPETVRARRPPLPGPGGQAGDEHGGPPWFKGCTFPENTEPAATGQGVVAPIFRRRQVSGPAGPGEDRRGKPPARWTVCLRPNGSSDCPESSEE